MKLILPYPPSVNTYWRHPTKGALAGRHLISAKGRQYRADCIALINQAYRFNRPSFNGRLAVKIVTSAPDRRRRDLDNINKAILDSLVHAGVIEDDSNIDDLHIVRGEPRQNIVTVYISEIGDCNNA